MIRLYYSSMDLFGINLVEFLQKNKNVLIYSVSNFYGIWFIKIHRTFYLKILIKKVK